MSLIHKQDHTICWNTSRHCPKCSGSSLVAKGIAPFIMLGLIELPLMALSIKAEGRCRDCNWHFALHQPWQHRGAFFVPWLMHWLSKNLGLLLLLFAGLWYWQVQAGNEQRVQRMLAQPKVDDFYFADMRELKQDTDLKYAYTSLRVIEVDGEQLLLRVGNIYHNQQVSPWRHFKADAAMQRSFYSRYTLSLTAETLRKLSEQGTIYAMRRPENLSSDGWIVLPGAEPGAELPHLRPFVRKAGYHIDYHPD